MEPLSVTQVLPVTKRLVSSLVSSWQESKTGTIIDNFQFAANKVLNVIFEMFIMFPSGGFLKISLNAFLLLLLPSMSWQLWRHLVSYW